MSIIIGLSGKKQSGKDTAANIIHGIMLKKHNLVKDYNISGDGSLQILTTNQHGKEGWGEFDINRKDEAFLSYAEQNMYPFVKNYSFADALKSICVHLFDIPAECVYGTEEEKNQEMEHLFWEYMPKFENTPFARKVLMPHDSVAHYRWKDGPMTAREFMQFFGTDLMRQMHEDIWLNACMRTIDHEQPLVAIIKDVRFKNEFEEILSRDNSYLVRLERGMYQDSHSSETDLDDYMDQFHYIVDNSGNRSLDQLRDNIEKIMGELLF